MSNEKMEKFGFALVVFIVTLLLIPYARASIPGNEYVIFCYNCSDCNAKMQNASPGDVIKLTTDIADHDGTCIEFNGADGITFDCDAHLISGDGDSNGIGIDLSGGSDNNTIKNCTICEFDRAIRIAHSQNNTVTDVVCKDNWIGGVHLYYANYNDIINVSSYDNNLGSGNNYGFSIYYSDYNTLTNLTARGNKGSVAYGGFYLERSNYNNFSDIVASDNSKYGIYIRWTSNHNRFRNAAITTYDGQGGLYVYSHSGQSTMNDIDTSNKINGKPIQFFDNYYKPCPDNQILNYNDTYSHIHFYGCSNISLYATILEDSLFLWSTSNSKIYNVNASHSMEGIIVWQSSANTFTNITTSHNEQHGIYMRYSDNNDFVDATSCHNSYGLGLDNSNNNVFTNVSACNNKNNGFNVWFSSYNMFTNATASNNSCDGMAFDCDSDSNTVKNSHIESNTNAGLEFMESGFCDPEYNFVYNNILNNTFNLKIEGGILNPNYLNSTLNCSSVTNIIGGQCIGGNFWADPNGTGWSHRCADVVEPYGICDEWYDLSNGGSVAIDKLPLAGNTSSEIIFCASCADCSQKLASARAGEVVQLVQDIKCLEGICIEFNGTDGVTFDCDGHTISGDGDGYGIHLNSACKSTIRNCPAIVQFHRGIYFSNAENNTITGVTVDNNQEGIYLLGSSRYNTITNSMIRNNTDYGIYLNASGSNYIRFNRFYNNYLNNSYNVYSNNGNNENYWNTTLDCSAASTNIIDRRCIGGNYWTAPDNGGYSTNCIDMDQDGICDEPYTVQSNNTDYLPLTGALNIKDCISCSDCSAKIASVSAGGTVRLISDITNQDCDCILITRSDVTFDGQNHRIDGNNDSNGFGIYIDVSSYGGINNVTLCNCTIREFDDGIYFHGASSSSPVKDSSINNVTVSNNKGHGIDLSYSHNNTLTDIKSCSNENDGIMIRDSSHNRLENIETKSNNQCGIYLLFSSSSSNILTNITSSSNSFAGIYLDRCSSTTINNSHITENGIFGINLNNAGCSGANQIYNNVFRNTNNINFVGTLYANAWNISQTSDTNIIGGSYMGGNFWVKPDGTGFSETCNDTDGNGICDESYNLTINNTDHLPLARVEISLPDLIITEKWVYCHENCTICYNVTNIGNGTAPAGHNTTLFVEDDKVAYDNIPINLSSNESHIGCFDDYNWIYTPSSDNITICADSNNSVVESDETNNCQTNIWICGDVNSDETVDMSDVIDLLYYVGYPGQYTICNVWSADVNRNKLIDMSDVIDLLYYVGYPGQYELKCCCT